MEGYAMGRAERNADEMASADRALLLVGPGPVALGQGPVLQHIAARGCRHLRRKGMRVLVVEDNPATLMDLEGEEGDLFLEPPAPEVIERVVAAGGASSISFGFSGRRGWLLALRMAGEGWYDHMGLRPPAYEDRVLWLCGDRSLLRETLEARGIGNPAFRAAGNMREGQEAAEELGFPLLVRPHFSSGGWGSGLAYNREEYPLLLGEALRESPTGEVLVEEALLGWRKFIVLVLRDGEGEFRAAGVIEQAEALPTHEEDAVLICPPASAGREGTYALEEMAREVAAALDLVGVAEIKLAVAPGWENLYVIDVNPRPWRNMPLLETLLGEDLLRLHLDLAMGEKLASGVSRMSGPGACAVAVPRSAFPQEKGDEGCRPLGCISMGRRLYFGGEAAAAADAALRDMRSTGGERSGAVSQSSLAALRRLASRASSGHAGGNPAAPGTEAEPFCFSRAAKEKAGEGLLILAGECEGPGGGYEEEVNSYLALRACMDMGIRAGFYTPDHNLALLAAEDADAVWIGPLEPEKVAEAAACIRANRIVPQFGGMSAMACAEELAEGGVETLGWEGIGACLDGRVVLERLRSAEVEVADFAFTFRREDAEDVLAGESLPMLATVVGGRGERVRRLIYSEEDGRDFLLEFGNEEIVWRSIWEEAQEVQVEAVRWPGGHLALLWEQVDEKGISNCDGLAVFPTRFLTSEQSQRVLGLTSRAMQAMGWLGNQSLRILIGGEKARLWEMTAGSSPNLPFLSRSCSLPLAAMGMLSLAGRTPEAGEPVADRNAVRAPLVPYGIIAASDILPSPQRRSTGSVLGMAYDPDVALAKAFWGEGLKPRPGSRVFLSVANREKRRAVFLARELEEMGYVIMATRGTANALRSSGMKVEPVRKLREGRPNILDFIRNGAVDMVINIPRGRSPHSDGFYIRAASARHGIPCVTDMEVALALARGLREAEPGAWEVLALREHRLSRPVVKGR